MVSVACSCLLAAMAVTAVSATVAPAAAHAAPMAAGPAPSPDQRAQAVAVRTGRPTAVAADTTAYSQVVANPNGSFTLTTAQQPQRVQQNGRWEAVDATLVVSPDGTWSPKAAVSGLILSGGGTGPLAVFDDHAGHVLSVRMPMRLPVPTASGNTLTFRSVLAGVDLSVTAGIDGGIHEVLVVHNVRAAANPLLTTLRIHVSTANLRLSRGSGGAIVASDVRTGDQVFSAPTPQMWDSRSTAATPARPASQRGDAGAADPANAVQTSSADGPGAGASVTAIPDTSSGSWITLTPPKAALTGPAVVFPAFIDPGISPARHAVAYTQSFHPTDTDGTYNPSDHLRVGLGDWPGGFQPGITRTYLNFTGLGPIDGKYITAASIGLTQQGASCTNTETIKASITNANAGFTSSLDWNNQPAPSGVTDSRTFTGSNTAYTFSIPTIGTWAAQYNYTSLNVVLHAADETNHCVFRWFSTTPTMSVTYWSTPNTPASLAVKNGGQAYACSTTAGSPSLVPLASNNQVSLTDTVSTPDAGTTVTAHMYLATDGAAFVDNPSSGVTEPTANAAVPVTKPITLHDGSSYAWYASTSNTYRTSATNPSSGDCYFRYDGTSPATPAAVNTLSTIGGGLSVQVTASDGGTKPTGVASLRYDIGGSGIGSGGIAGSVVAPSGTATISVPASELGWGTNTIWLQAVDGAGNLSGVYADDVYVPQSAIGAYGNGTAGDIDGDNIPDLVTVSVRGDIQLYADPETTNPATGSSPYGGKVLIPAQSDSLYPGGTFAGAIVTHAGNFSGAVRADDLIIQQRRGLAVAVNPGATGSWVMEAVTRPGASVGGCGPANGDYNPCDWSSVVQMVAIPGATAADRPSLLTLEFYNGRYDMWLYRPAPGSGQAFQMPTLIASDTSDWHWESTQLLAATPLPGLTGDTLVLRDSDGTIDEISNITAGFDPDVDTSTGIDTGVYPASQPLVASVGRADSAGNWTIWATATDGTLRLHRYHTASIGATTVANDVSISPAGWGTHQVSLENNSVPYNSIGLVDDGTVAGGSFDSHSPGMSYSAQALASANIDSGDVTGCPVDPAWTAGCGPTGLAPGYLLATADGVLLTMPDAAPDTADNYVAAGQILAAPTIDGGGSIPTTLTLLGAASTSNPTGATDTITITYTDGTVSTPSVTFSDWTLDGGTTSAAAADSVAVDVGYRDSTDGSRDNTPTYLFTTQIALAPGKTMASIALPNDSAMHVFATAAS